LRDQAKIAIKLKDEVSKRDSVITLYQQKTVITNSRINDLQSSVLLLENTQKNKDYLHLQDIDTLNKKLKVQKVLKWGFLALPPLGYMIYKLIQ